MRSKPPTLVLNMSSVLDGVRTNIDIGMRPASRQPRQPRPPPRAVPPGPSSVRKYPAGAGGVKPPGSGREGRRGAAPPAGLSRRAQHLETRPHGREVAAAAILGTKAAVELSAASSPIGRIRVAAAAAELGSHRRSFRASVSGGEAGAGWRSAGDCGRRRRRAVVRSSTRSCPEEVETTSTVSAGQGPGGRPAVEASRWRSW